MENKNGFFYHPQDMNLDNYPVQKTDDVFMYEQVLYQDPKTGVSVLKVRYPKGFLVPWHTHPCCHGHYILSGTMKTSEGDFGPGSFVWFKEGAPMFHGNPDEDVEALVFEDKPFDIHFLENMPKEY